MKRQSYANRYGIYCRLRILVPSFMRIAGVILLLCCSFVTAEAKVLTKDTVWSGTVNVPEDILVPKEVTLTILPGTVIRFARSDSTKTDPEYISPLTELTVRGVLRVEGSAVAPVIFSGNPGEESGSWAGVLIDGGAASIHHCTIQGAENGVQVFSGDVQLLRTTLTGNRYGVVAQGKGSRVRMTDSVIRENEYGQTTFNGAEITATASTVSSNRKHDRNDWTGETPDPFTAWAPQSDRQVTRIYQDEVLRGETVWRGRIQVTGQVRIPEGARLIITPGTVVEFTRRDSNGDGIGENGLLIQGVLFAKGMREAPIFFRSAEKNPALGDWDSINIMNSDGVRNLVEFCQIEDAYRGLHFHFSHVQVNRSIFRNSYRGIQFQESQVTLSNNRFHANKSAVQGRDSEIVFTGNLVQENLRGVNIFRADITADGNRFSANALDGLRLRDSGATIEKNIFDGNRYGLMAQDAFYGRYAANLVSGNAELGFSLKKLDNLEITGNYFSRNGTNGISLQEVGAFIRGNAFSDNRERGIGIVSFDGVITENNFASNGLYAIDLESARDISASANWWGGGPPDRVIYDGTDLKGRGKVDTREYRTEPLPYAWPISEIPVNLLWRGGIRANQSVSVPAGVSLSIAPGTAVSLAADVSILVKGKLLAHGEPAKRISFAPAGAHRPGFWGEILLERAVDSIVENCDFTGATWALHSHFTNLVVSGSRFENNFGGIRFRSGPVTISRSLFTGNEIGIRSYRGIAQITANEITGNDVGIFVREKGGGLEISNNDLSGNSGYAIRIGDFNDEDVKAARNWWGEGDPGSFIFDAVQEEGIGFVRYAPVLTIKPKVGAGER